MRYCKKKLNVHFVQYKLQLNVSKISDVMKINPKVVKTKNQWEAESYVGAYFITGFITELLQDQGINLATKSVRRRTNAI